MVIHNVVSVYWGDACDGLFPSVYNSLSSVQEYNAIPAFVRLQQQHSLDALLFLKQTHGCLGLTIDDTVQARTLVPFNREGDFLITSVPHVGIGVMTADCLPVVLYDQRQHVIAIVHAGWRGAVAGIVPMVIEQLQHNYETRLHDLAVLFGPSAQACCYQVTDDFRQQFAEKAHEQNFFARRNQKMYFDLPFFVRQQLFDLGVSDYRINRDHNVCTICTLRYCSYRRQGTHAGRQMSVVWMRL